MRRVSLTVAAAVLTLPLAGTATSLAASSTPGTPPSSSTSSTSSASASSPSTAPGRSSQLTPLPLRLDAKGAIDRAALPDADELFTKAELGQAIPKLRATTPDADAITLDIAGEKTDERSSLLVTMKNAGKKADVEKAWTAHKRAHEARAKKEAGLYTFFGANAMGVTDSFTDGTTTHVLLTNGDAAAEVWFSGIGFGSSKSTHSASRADYTKTIVPKLITILGQKVSMAASQPKKPTTGAASASPSTSPSPSSSQSATSDSSTS